MDAHQALVLILLSAGAFTAPLLSERIGWFVAPSEILFGTLVATVWPGATRPGPFVDAMSQFGFLLLLFLAGMEIDFALLGRLGAAALGRAAAAAAGIQGLGLAVALAMRLPPITALLYGALSISMLLVILRERGLSRGPFGQTLLVVGAIGEFLTILELTGYDLTYRYGVGGPLALATLKLLALLLLGYLALRGLRRAFMQRPARFRRLLAVHDPAEVGVRAALAFMLCFAAVAVLLHVEDILAAFIAGAVCSFAFRGSHALHRKLTTIGQGFFIPMFFVTVGLGLHLGDLLGGRSLELAVGLLVAIPLLRAPAAALLHRAGASWTQATAGALLLSVPLTLQVAITQVGISLGQLDASAHSGVLGAMVTSAVLFPLLARPFLPRADARAPAAEDDAELRLPPDEPQAAERRPRRLRGPASTAVRVRRPVRANALEDRSAAAWQAR